MNAQHIGKSFCAGCLVETFSERCMRPDCASLQAKQPQSHLRYHTLLKERYYIGHSLGQGGFGVTYKALDLKDEVPRPVAIKEYLPLGWCDRSDDSGGVQPCPGDLEATYWRGMDRFIKEGENLRKFSLPSHGPPVPGSEISRHANIVGCMEVFKANGTAYLVMEYIIGPTLEDHLKKKGGAISYSKAIEILVPAMDGLRAMHREQMIHRDISPTNIMLGALETSGGADAFQAKLVDFGAARLAIGERNQNLTVIIKPGYAPMEQYSTNGHQGPWSDVYAVGATFYRCITGEKPPPAQDRWRMDNCIAPGVLYSKRHSGETLPSAVEAALLTGLALETDRRFQTIADFQRALLSSSGITPDGVIEEFAIRREFDGPSMRPCIWMIGVAVLFICAVLIGMIVRKREASATNSRESIALYRENKFAQAAGPLDIACKDGSLEACKDLGNLYLDGKGVLRDRERALLLFIDACQSGYNPACNNLAMMYADGTAGKQDLQKAVEIYTNACNQGFDMSCANLSNLYRTSPVIRNEARAALFYGKACDHNYAAACVSLARMYDGSLSALDKDLQQAATLYEKACALSDLNGCLSLGSMADAGWDGATADPQRATSLYKQVCDKGDFRGCNNLANMYFNSHNEADQKYAVSLYRESCSHDIWAACVNLGLAYQDGTLIPKDFDQAMHFFNKACEAGYGRGCSEIGNMYRMAIGEPKNKDEALIWLNKGCDLGDTNACNLRKKIDSADDMNDLFRGLLK